jgi:hypothetical protein
VAQGHGNLALTIYWCMIFVRKPVPTFRDHARTYFGGL